MIRVATLDDVPRILELGAQSLIDGPYAGKWDNNPEQARKLAEHIINTAGQVLLYEEGGAVHGLLGFVVSPHFFTGEIVAAEIMWYVLPEHRAGGHALTLLWEAEKTARLLGATRLQFTAPNEKVGDIYTRFGFEKIEVLYQKELACP